MISDASLKAELARLKRYNWIPQHELSRVSGGREYDGGRLEEAEAMLKADHWEFDQFIDGWVPEKRAA